MSNILYSILLLIITSSFICEANEVIENDFDDGEELFPQNKTASNETLKEENVNKSVIEKEFDYLDHFEDYFVHR